MYLLTVQVCFACLLAIMIYIPLHRVRKANKTPLLILITEITSCFKWPEMAFKFCDLGALKYSQLYLSESWRTPKLMKVIQRGRLGLDLINLITRLCS